MKIKDMDLYNSTNRALNQEAQSCRTLLMTKYFFFSIIFCLAMKAALISVARFGRKVPDSSQVSSRL